MLIQNGLQAGFGFAPIAFKSDQHFHFIPNVIQALVVIGNRGLENSRIGQVDDPPGTLFIAHPIAHFHNGKLKQIDGHHIANFLIHLNAVPEFEGLLKQNKIPPGHIHNGILKGNGQSSREQTEIGGKIAKLVGPDKGQCHRAHNVNAIGHIFAPSIPQGNVALQPHD